MKRRRRRRRITLAELKGNHKLAAQLARRKGGVDVVDDVGRVVFTLSMSRGETP